MDRIKIGGKEYPIKLRYNDVKKILEHYNKYALPIAKRNFKILNGHMPEEGDSIIINDIFFFWALWKVLLKKRTWPFRKPFRSLKHLVSNIEIEEATTIVQLIGDRILHTETKREDRNPGNSGEKKKKS